MSKRNIQSVDADFLDVTQFLGERGVIPANPSSALIESAKKIHRATHSLILWRFRLKGLPEHGQAFIEEIASDALQILPQVLMGYGKTAKLLTRGIIENTLRHLYFSDHPIEFARMNRDTKWYLTMEALFDYPKTHPLFLETESKFDALNRLSTLYSDLSAGIHGRRVQDLEMRIALKKIAYDESGMRRQVDLSERCAGSANFMLATFHRDRMNNFQTEDRRLILRTMPPRARQVWNQIA
jgi:hypothetical protein